MEMFEIRCLILSIHKRPGVTEILVKTLVLSPLKADADTDKQGGIGVRLKPLALAASNSSHTVDKNGSDLYGTLRSRVREFESLRGCF